MTSGLDPETEALVAVSAVLGGEDEPALRARLARAAEVCEASVVEEAVLQAYLFLGFPAVLRAMAVWRELSGPPEDGSERHTVEAGDPEGWSRRGEALCRTIYGSAYEKLRARIAGLHPDLDAWMLMEGYGKVLARPGLDVRGRELCIVAILAGSPHEPQLHSHLRGALNAGAAPAEIEATLLIALEAAGERGRERARRIWDRVREGRRCS